MTHSFTQSLGAYHSHPYVIVVSDFRQLRSDEAVLCRVADVCAAVRMLTASCVGFIQRFRWCCGVVLAFILPVLRPFCFVTSGVMSYLCRPAEVSVGRFLYCDKDG